MLKLAQSIGIPTPEHKLIDMSQVTNLPDMGLFKEKKALAVKRFDRGDQGQKFHIEDFAQVYDLYPHEKYKHVSYANMANVIFNLCGESGLTDFVRRLVFSIMIGNGDMHLKNWSLLYDANDKVHLSPIYDQVSTVIYLPNDQLALTLGDVKNMEKIDEAMFTKFAIKGYLPKVLVLDTVKEATIIIREQWRKQASDFPLPKEFIQKISAHMDHQLNNLG